VHKTTALFEQQGPLRIEELGVEWVLDLLRFLRNGWDVDSAEE